ncbi:MAG: hypothetical protein Q4C20_06205 [Erysipelotrichaceae bacterium]|nr:hypothetical protein [Erysipelotrichaceae bacterium]
MLKSISSICDYRDFFKSEAINLDCAQRKRLSSKLFLSALHKLKKLDPTLASDLLFSYIPAQEGLPLIHFYSNVLSFLCNISVTLPSPAGVMIFTVILFFSI